jgi:hypothetical protein
MGGLEDAMVGIGVGAGIGAAVTGSMDAMGAAALAGGGSTLLADPLALAAAGFAAGGAAGTFSGPGVTAVTITGADAGGASLLFESLISIGGGIAT